MNRRISRKIENYLYQAAGKTWNIPNVQIEINELGSEVIPGRETTRMTRFVAKEICSTYTEINGDELNFLCNITGTTYTEVASKIGVTKGIVSKWVAKKDSSISLANSILIKKYFFLKIFGNDNLKDVSIFVAYDDEKLFQYIKDKIAA